MQQSAGVKIEVFCPDERRDYTCIESIPGVQYTHHTVNHSQNFVDPTTGSHTQSVESMWSSCKQMMRKTQTMQSQLFHTYLPEFMWRKRFHGSHQNAFNIIDYIAEHYPIL